MRKTTALALFALQVATTLAQNATCNPGPCVGPEVIALESSDCQDYHVFLARGSDSGYPGHLGPLTKLICDGLGDSCGYENIIYPAKSQYRGPGAWCESAHAGAENGQAQLASYAERCPDSKLILAGYSQGGSVSLDILGGGGGAGFGCDDQAYNAPLSGTEAPGSHIVAAIVFGAVVPAAGQNYTLERTVTRNGVSPREFNGTQTRSADSLAAIRPYSSILREYCNVGDPVCAKGGPNSDVKNHLNYFDLYNSDAAAWVVATAQGKNYTPKDTANEETHSPTRETSTPTSPATATKTHAPTTALPKTETPTPSVDTSAASMLTISWSTLAIFCSVIVLPMYL